MDLSPCNPAPETFVFTQIHNVQSNIPPEDVVAVYDAAFKYGGYPIGG